MRYPPPPASLFTGNRNRLAKRLRPNSLVIVVANDILPTNADSILPFKQNSDLFYLSGVDQEETILMLYPDAFDQEKHRELLFLRETNEHIAVWEGERLTKERAADVSGIDIRRIHWLSEFNQIWRTLMLQAEHVYLNLNEHPRADILVESREARFLRECRKKFPLHRYERLAPILAGLRMVKSAAEIGLLREAIAITAAGFARVAEFVEPGVGEWEIEAELAHEFLRRRSRGFAYIPIIATGRNACILHYVENHSECRDGELLLLDVGAEYANYNADLTRTVPVNGRFSKRQRRVYNAVLRVFRTAASLLRPGLRLKEWTRQVGEAMEKELVDLRLLKLKEVRKQDPDKPLYKKYFMHGIGHHLGLDVHDVEVANEAVKAGMVFTIEPGIYIREEGIGVRLENDVLVGATKNTDLMAAIPLEADEIEEAMR